MANLTIVVDDQLLKDARIKALQQGTSVNEVCREAIARFAGATDQGHSTLDALRKLASQVPPSPSGEAAWPGREALYDEVLGERGLNRLESPSAVTPQQRRR
ncbi:hypothetical protein [Aquabacterium sp.]|uniref:hypothetical protein n=1 Tax=Aquabacterium sp. TaxID=1872578 RepID=UPI002C11BA75|nr:hypothetical protein [Aquabacterium sp.]HSW05965.1 hypothetical protein [Aquabacterium sp.]